MNNTTISLPFKSLTCKEYRGAAKNRDVRRQERCHRRDPPRESESREPPMREKSLFRHRKSRATERGPLPFESELAGENHQEKACRRKPPREREELERHGEERKKKVTWGKTTTPHLSHLSCLHVSTRHESSSSKLRRGSSLLMCF